MFGIAVSGQPHVAQAKLGIALKAALKELSATGHYIDIWVFDSKGRLVTSAIGSVPAPFITAAALSSLSRDTVVVTGPRADGAGTSIAIARRIPFAPPNDTSKWLPSGTVMGSVVLMVDPGNTLFRGLSDEDEASSGGSTLMLVVGEDSVFEFPSAGHARNAWARASLPPLERAALASHPDSIGFIHGAYVQTVRTTDGAPWRLIRRASTASVYRAADARLLNELALAGLVALGAVWLLLARARAAREQRMREVQASETNYRLLAENATDIIARHGIDGHITYISPAVHSTLGYEQSEMIGHCLADRTALGAESAIAALVVDSFATVDVITVEYVMRHADGRDVWVETLARAVRDPETGRVQEMVTVTRDISARKETEEALSSSEEYHRTLFTSNPIPMWTLDRESRALLAVNDASLALYGYTREEFLSMNASDLATGNESDLVQSLFSDMGRGAVTPLLSRHRHNDGHAIDVELFAGAVRDSGNETGLVVVKDVTDRTKLENQLRHSQKMDAVGKLAGGVAHDFNNMLTVISSYACMILAEGADPETLREDVGEIKAAADRAAALTRQLLAFSRQQVLEPRIIDLNVLVGGVEQMLRRLLPADINLRTSLASSLGPVLADPGQLEQVLVNLVVNARDAMPGGGIITIETMNLSADPTSITPGSDIPRVMIAVTDTGCGMSKELQTRIFDPFYTTKEAGSGTGLGLSTAHGIVTQSNGTISVYSEPGVGSTFKICLPHVREALSVGSGDQDETTHGADAGSGTILLVEDDTPLRLVATRILEDAGYTVRTASNGIEALRIVEEHGEPIDLVLTDMVMPEVGGRELVTTLREQGNAVPVLYMSGYTEQSSRNRRFLDDNSQFIQKPFTPHELTRKVAEVLRKTSTVGAA